MVYNYYKDGVSYPITPSQIARLNVQNHGDRRILMQLQRRYPSLAPVTRGVSMITGNLIMEVMK
jgi:hypothetical protein